MINKIQINSVMPNTSKAFRGIATNPNNCEQKCNSDFYLSKNAADALKSYNISFMGTNIDKPMSLESYIKQLENSGLVKDKDFSIISHEDGATIFIEGKDDDYGPTKAIYWYEGNGINNYYGYEDLFYPNDNDIECISKRYNKNGKMYEKTIEYKFPDKHKDLFPAGIDKNTTPESYINYLKQNNIDYEIENGDNCTWVLEQNKETYFDISEDDTHIAQHALDNKNDNLIHNFSLYNNSSYGNYTIKVSDYSRDAFNS